MQSGTERVDDLTVMRFLIAHFFPFFLPIDASLLARIRPPARLFVSGVVLGLPGRGGVKDFTSLSGMYQIAPRGVSSLAAFGNLPCRHQTLTVTCATFNRFATSKVVNFFMEMNSKAILKINQEKYKA